MSYEQKNIIVQIGVSLLIWVIYGVVMQRLIGEGYFDGPDQLKLLGRAMLMFIPASIVGTIIGTILFHILYAIATNDPAPDFSSDERDKMISIRGMQVTMVVASTGFILGCVALALGSSAFLVFNIILIGFGLGDLMGNITKLWMYRGGFVHG